MHYDIIIHLYDGQWKLINDQTVPYTALHVTAVIISALKGENPLQVDYIIDGMCLHNSIIGCLSRGRVKTNSHLHTRM